MSFHFYRVFPFIFSRNFDDQLSSNFHRFIILCMLDTLTENTCLRQLSKVSSAFKESQWNTACCSCKRNQKRYTKLRPLLSLKFSWHIDYSGRTSLIIYQLHFFPNRAGFLAASKNFDENDFNVDLSGKSFMLNGANTGIGKRVTMELAKRGKPWEDWQLNLT